MLVLFVLSAFRYFVVVLAFPRGLPCFGGFGAFFSGYVSPLSFWFLCVLLLYLHAMHLHFLYVRLFLVLNAFCLLLYMFTTTTTTVDLRVLWPSAICSSRLARVVWLDILHFHY